MPEKHYEIASLALRYWFVALIGTIFVKCLLATLKDFKKSDGNEGDAERISALVVFLCLSAFGLLSVQNPEGIEIWVLVLGILASALFLFQFFALKFFFRGIDPYLLLMVDTLSVIGFIMLHRLDSDLAFRQVEWFGLSSIFLSIVLFVTRKLKTGKRFFYPLMGAGLILLLLTLILGEEVGGARSWLTIGEHSIQPSEFVKLIMIIVFAIDFSQAKTLKQRIPVLIFAALAVLLVVLQRDLGAALLYFSLFVFLYYIGTSDWKVTAAAILSGSLGATAAYHIFNHVRVRVAAWRNPWADVEGYGYQIIQSLIAIGSGGLVGSGLGLGKPAVIPAATTDFIFSAVCEEMGVLVGIFIIGFYILILMKGTTTALKAHTPFAALLAMGATISLAIQSFIIIGGVIKFIPLTGITVPFISYGGSSMMVSFGALGIMEGVADQSARAEKEQEGNGSENGEEDEE